MGRGLQGAILTALGAKVHRATVTGTRMIGPDMLLVSFRSEGLLRDVERPGSFLRGWFPDPEKPATLQQRGYTILDPNPAEGTFDVAFLLHEPAGPASTWARSAEPGDEIAAQRLGAEGGYDVAEHEGDGYLLVGDAAAWPAMSSIVATVPHDTPVRVLMEVHSEADRALPYPEHPRLDLVHVPGDAGPRALVDAVAGGDYRGWQTWVTAESAATRLVRTELTTSHAQNKATMHAQAYWVAGRAMGTEKTVPEAEGDPQRRNAGDDEPRAAGAGTEGVTAPGSSVAPPRDAETSPRPEPSRRPGPDPAPAGVLSPARTAMIVAGLAQAVLSVLAVLPLILFAEVGRLLARGADTDDIRGVLLWALVVLAVEVVGTTALLTGLHLYDAHYAAALRRRVLTTLTRLPLGWFTSRSSADVTRLVRTDVGSLHYLVTHAVPDLVGAVVMPLVILGYLFSVDWLLALLLLVPVVAYITLMFRVAAADKPLTVQILRYDALLRADTQRYLEGQAVSRIFGDDATVDLPAELAELDRVVTGAQHGSIGVKTVALRLNRPVTSLVLLSVLGTVLVIAGWTEPAALIPFLVLGTSFADRLVAISYAGGGLRAGLEARGELELLLTTRTLAEPAGAQRAVSGGPATTPAAPADSRLDRVGFGYTPGRDVLSDLDLELVPGGVTALVGPSGSGKSTVASLVARFWDPDTGAVRLDGTDVRDLPEAAYREQLATVLQDARLIRGTLRENLVLGRPDASDAELADAIDAAHLDEVVARLPKGLDTSLDRESLSGGQRQRVAIARALLGNARIVVLDEATAAADPDSEWAVKRGLDRLLDGRTVLAISHRLHTVAGADRIVVMDGGRVVESGTHASLLDREELYARMVRQSRASTEPAVPVPPSQATDHPDPEGPTR